MSDHVLPPAAPSPARSGPRRRTAVDAAILVLMAVGASLVSVSVLGLGVLAPQTLLMFAAAFVAVVVLRPEWLFVITGALLFFPGKRTIFPFELTFGLLVFITVIEGIRRRDRDLLRLDRFEVFNLMFVLWAALTVFWCTDFRIYLHGMRRLLEGVLAFWTAFRLARFVPRRVFESSLLAMAFGLSISALIQYLLRTGFGQHEVDRASATNLGWGKANAIATMLLMLGPPILDMAFRAKSPVLRGLAWVSSGFTMVMQLMIASRAATILYVGALYSQLTVGRWRQRVFTALAVSVVVAAAMFTPSGQALLSRFTNLRELGGMVIRIWYAREAWNRTVAGFPLGIGLNQGQVQADKLGSVGTHDYWLDVSSELGVLGILLWIAFWVVLWLRIRTITRTAGWLWEGRALHISFWMSFIHACVEPTFGMAHYQFVFFWLFGGYLGYHAVGATREAEEKRERGRAMRAVPAA